MLGPEGSQMIYGDTVIDLQDHTIHEEALAAVMERALPGGRADRHPAERAHYGYGRLRIFPL